MTSQFVHPKFDFLSGGGEMGALMRLNDWAATPLGPPATWPVALKTSLRLILTSNHPMLIMWGGELIQFYNDAFAQTLGPERHPVSLGQPSAKVWAEVWHAIGEDIDFVMAGKGATWYEDKLIASTRHGKQEDIWWTYGFSPIEDESGVQGVLTICNDVTEEHIAREALKQSHQILVESMDEGFCVFDVLVDALDCPIDYRYIETNPAFEKQSGLTNAIGKTIKELLPNIESRWLEVYGRVAVNSESVRFVEQVISLERWFDVYAFPIRDVKSKKIGVLFKDVTEQKRAEEELGETAARLKFTLDSAQIGDWYFDAVSDIAYHSLRHDRCFGYSEPVPDWSFNQFIGHVHPDDRDWVRQDFAGAVCGTKDWHFECRVIWPDDSVHWIAMHGSTYSVDGKPAKMTGIVIDITDRKQAEERVLHASLHDSLTGLPNRAMLFEYASHLLSHNMRSNQYAAVLFFDLDRFKPINDSHGHDVGDAVLQDVAARLSKRLRAEDIVVRLGGDEFVILLQDIKETVYASDVARQMLVKIMAPYQIGELTLSLSASVGISIFPDDGHDIDTLISHADMAMYQAKQTGRNNFQFYCPQFAASTMRQLAIEQQLREALSAKTFYLHFQPVIHLATREIVSVEALLRWQHNEIGPDLFVPVAEATGLINPISAWLLEQACRQYKEWIAQGLDPIPIAVNVSAVEFRANNFVGRFKEVLRQHGIPMSALQLELTETSMMDDLDHAAAVLCQLKSLGVTVLLDDFGTGHSSLAYLARLPLNKVKIDKSFISGLETDLACRAVTDAMITLGRTVNLEVVAEGIESANILDYVCAHGCTQAQGYFLGRPMSGDDFALWYREREKNSEARNYKTLQSH